MVKCSVDLKLKVFFKDHFIKYKESYLPKAAESYCLCRYHWSSTSIFLCSFNSRQKSLGFFPPCIFCSKVGSVIHFWSLRRLVHLLSLKQFGHVGVWQHACRGSQVGWVGFCHQTVVNESWKAHMTSINCIELKLSNSFIIFNFY